MEEGCAQSVSACWEGGATARVACRRRGRAAVCSNPKTACCSTDTPRWLSGMLWMAIAWKPRPSTTCQIAT
jgi:hypothetical protein